MPLIKMVKKEDGAKNHLMTDMRLDIELNGMDPSTIRNIQVMASFDYVLQERLKIEMKTLMHVDVDTPNGASNTQIYGDLQFMQEGPVKVDSLARVIYNYDPISAIEFMSRSLPEIIQAYNERSGKYSILAANLNSREN